MGNLYYNKSIIPHDYKMYLRFYWILFGSFYNLNLHISKCLNSDRHDGKDLQKMYNYRLLFTEHNSSVNTYN